MKPLLQCASELWISVCLHVKRSVVFIDSVCSEILHWNGGVLKLVEAGAMDVKEFSSFESAAPAQKKGVFIVSSILHDVTAAVIRDVIQASSFQYVVVITAVSPQVHVFSKMGNHSPDLMGSLGLDLFQQFEENLLEWMGNMNYTAEVFHVPLSTICLGQNLFVMPAYLPMFPLLKIDVRDIDIRLRISKSQSPNPETPEKTSCLPDLELHQLSRNTQIFFKMFISSFNDILEQLSVKEDVYSVGHTSRLLATELENYPPAKARRKNCNHKASVIFIDRSLDIVGPVGHQMETLFDQLLATLPSLPGHSIDRLVNIEPLRSTVESPMDTCVDRLDTSGVAPGSLLSGLDENEQELIETLVINKQKDALSEVNHRLLEAAVQEKLPVKVSKNRNIHENLKATLNLFKGRYKVMQPHLSSIQIALALVQLAKHPSNSQFTHFQAMEKVLLQTTAEKNVSPLNEISEILCMCQSQQHKTPRERLYSLDDVWCLLLFCYSLAGKDRFLWAKEERGLQAGITKEIMSELNNLPPVTKSLVKDCHTESAILAVVEDVWEKLRSIGDAREDLKLFSSVLSSGDQNNPPMYRPILKQMIEHIYAAGKPDLGDIECKSGGLKDLLKTGFSLFMNVAKPRPSDNPLIIIFVIGGITSTEVKQIKETLAAVRADSRVLIGSTRAVEPRDLASSILSGDRNNPWI